MTCQLADEMEACARRQSKDRIETAEENNLLLKGAAALRETRDALRPFADYAVQMETAWEHRGDSAYYGVKRVGACQVSYGDFRRAAREVYK